MPEQITPNTQIITNAWAPVVDKVGVPLMWVGLGLALGFYLGSKRR